MDKLVTLTYESKPRKTNSKTLFFRFKYVKLVQINVVMHYLFFCENILPLSVRDTTVEDTYRVLNVS